MAGATVCGCIILQRLLVLVSDEDVMVLRQSLKIVSLRHTTNSSSSETRTNKMFYLCQTIID
jgi:hypothetical protein